MNPALHEGTESLMPMLVVAGVLWLIVIALFVEIRREK
jgi:hypothetical protein